MIRRNQFYGAILFLAAFALGAWGGNEKRNGPANFDYYVLSLSWSPTYCLFDGANGRGGSQCATGAGFGFIVHGLWPQYEQGFPRNCQSVQNGPSSGLVSGMQDIMPSRRLVEMAWQRHGTCSGLSAPEYFGLLRSAYAKIRIPRIENADNLNAGQIEQIFMAANPNLDGNEIAISASNGRIAEARICLTKELNFRACNEIDRRGAPNGQNLIIPMRR